MTPKGTFVVNIVNLQGGARVLFSATSLTHGNIFCDTGLVLGESGNDDVQQKGLSRLPSDIIIVVDINIIRLLIMILQQ